MFETIDDFCASLRARRSFEKDFFSVFTSILPEKRFVLNETGSANAVLAIS